METSFFPGILLISYCIGSIPFGLIFVRLISGKDIRKVESGRTGGTNAVRAAGYGAGLATAVMDVLKGAFSVWLARWLAPGYTWLQVLAPMAAILGHNYSVFLLERGEDGRLHFRGGAGGATCIGGAIGLWPPSILIIVPLAGAIWYGVGYASVTTISAALIAGIIFAIRAAQGYSPWLYVFYGVLAEVVLVWALRPNIQRLIQGKERLIGWRARHKKTASRGI
ncbi:MAG TPA: glycerol-3-phosphate acyltransferase [Anaerolineaceae bacterium]|nr:glycerol-3-phosphate acyltransferase [Anaerolineaceae bacterium]